MRDTLMKNEGLTNLKNFYCPWSRSSYGWIFFETSDDLRDFQRAFKDLKVVYQKTGIETQLWTSIRKTQEERDINGKLRRALNWMNEHYPTLNAEVCWNSAALWTKLDTHSPILKIEKSTQRMLWHEGMLQECQVTVPQADRDAIARPNSD